MKKFLHERNLGLLYLLLVICAPLYSEMSLRVADMQGAHIKEVNAGEPFLMVVSHKDAQAQTQDPHIDGMQDLYVKRIGHRMTSINGARSVEHTYQVRIDKPGSYQLGPATDPDTHERSGCIRIKVCAGTAPKVKKETHAKKVTKNTDPVLLRLWCDKDQVYVGQEIKAVLRFYVPEDEQISIEQVVAEDPASVTVSEKLGPQKGVQEIEGKRYVFYEWQWDMFAQQAGDLVVPASMLDYAKHLPLDNYMTGWAAFFGPRYERKRVYSNALTIHVQPLPATSTPVQAVGHFTNYTAQLNPPLAKQYEGMVLKLSVDGSGNIHTIQSPDLVMPEGFTWYASKHYVEDTPYGKRTTFEYIVQGLQPGDAQIPEQTFTFFDVDTAQYKQLKTAPLFVSITPVQTVKQTYSGQDVSTVQPEQSATALIKPLLQRYHQSKQTMPLQLLWFIILLLAPIVSMMIFKVRALMDIYLPYCMPSYTKRRAYAQAQKELALLCAQHNVQALNLFFVRYIERIRGKVTTGDIVHIIQNSALADEQKKEAIQFFEKVTEVAYMQTDEQDDALCQQAKHWLDVLKEIV